ncbi:MAG: dimethylsulfonioproprionate lyase family protein [Paracoccaceae bacterium]
MSDFWAELASAPGPKGSGRLRYGAAMALYHQGQLSDAALEVYRICSLLDRQDPSVLLTELRLTAAQSPVETAESAIRGLVAEADLYLVTLPGPGVAEVRAGLNKWRSGPVTATRKENAVLAAHLPAALDGLLLTHPALARAIAAAAPYLDWITYDGYGPEIGAAFAKGHCFASIIGEDAAMPAREFDFGLFLIAPNVLYRDHHHAAPELYAPLTGPHGWRFGAGDPLIIKAAHQPVWNHPHRPHLTKVGAVPFLGFFGWTADVQAPAKVIPAEDWTELEALRLGT